MRPKHILFFGLFVIALLVTISLVHPQPGIFLTKSVETNAENFTKTDSTFLKFPTLSKIFILDTITHKDIAVVFEDTASDNSEQLEEILEVKPVYVVDPLDPTKKTILIDGDMLKQLQVALKFKSEDDSLRYSKRKLHYPNDDKSIMYPFFLALDELMTGNGKIRVLHYGDSQIEGDRITSYLRYKLQNQFGGRGVGMLPASNLVNNGSVRRENIGFWKRYSTFGKKDTTVTHKRYGIEINYGRFCEYGDNDTIHESAVKFTRGGIRFSNTKTYNNFIMYFSHNVEPFTVELYEGDSLMATEEYVPSEVLRKFHYRFKGGTPKEFTVKFRGKDSPDIYSFQLESDNGLMVDNLAMRGSSGTVFTSRDQTNLSEMYAQHDVRLLILQYGGNVMPYVNTDEKIEAYGKRFERQIARLKKYNPDAAVIVIGPSDMAHQVDGEWESYTYIGKVRDALKQAAFNQGGAYWDVYEAMGGAGAMIQWATQEPPMASTDHIHFSHKGARQVASWFYDALSRDYLEYFTLKGLLHQKEQQEEKEAEDTDVENENAGGNVLIDTTNTVKKEEVETDSIP